MARYLRFTFLVNQEERDLITDLAHYLQRSQSDAVRFVVINAARELERNQAMPETLWKGVPISELEEDELHEYYDYLTRMAT